MEVTMEEQITLDDLIQQTYDWLVDAKYSKGTLYSFRCITNQLKSYAAERNEIFFSVDLALSFLEPNRTCCAIAFLIFSLHRCHGALFLLQ